jgi:hypothetical protein
MMNDFNQYRFQHIPSANENSSEGADNMADKLEKELLEIG